jgi:hypothetical protein
LDLLFADFHVLFRGQGHAAALEPCIYLQRHLTYSNYSHLLSSVPMSRLSTFCMAAHQATLDSVEAQLEPPTNWYNPGPDFLQQLDPQGVEEVPHDASWTIHPTRLWIFGNHPEATPGDMKRLEAMLEKNLQAFAYGLARSGTWLCRASHTLSAHTRSH